MAAYAPSFSDSTMKIPMKDQPFKGTLVVSEDERIFSKLIRAYRGDSKDVWTRFDEHEPGIPLSTMKRQLKRGIPMNDRLIVRRGGLRLWHVCRG